MRIEQRLWTQQDGWTVQSPANDMDDAQLVLVFGATARMKNVSSYRYIREIYPQAYIIGCSTAGEIMETSVMDDTIAVTAVQFGNSRVKGYSINVSDFRNSFEAGKHLAGHIPIEDLRHVFILSDGLNVNGTDLIHGILDVLPESVSVTGGLSGDGDRFLETYVMGNGPAEKDTIVLTGFYGENLNIGFGSRGGWDPFGPERIITSSEGNVLYSLDGKSALELYKKYLGKQAEGLPATGLLFPLSIRTDDLETPVVRTILSVDETSQSMTFAGDIPLGGYAKLMKANFDRLIDGAVGAAEVSRNATRQKDSELAVLISCVGRKMVLKQRVEEEVEGVRDILGTGTKITGFYSYGEISPFQPGVNCELHNQTMTITTFSETHI